MNSNLSALDALAQEGILMTEEQLLRETQKVRSNGNGSTPALAKGEMAYTNGTSRALPAAFIRADIALDQQPGIAIAPDQRATDSPAVSPKPTDIPRLDGDFLVISLAIVGGIAGAILAVAAGGDGGAFFGGGFLGAIVGAVIGGTISAFLWSIGVHEDEADCSGCGRELDPTLYVCPNCATPVKHQWGKAPVELTPSDHVLLDMVPKKSKEENGRSWVEVGVPPGVSTDQLNRVLATALLANEEAGAIRLKMAKGKLVAVQHKCPSNCSAEMSPVWSTMVSDGDIVDATGDRRVGGLSASTYLLTVSL